MKKSSKSQNHLAHPLNKFIAVLMFVVAIGAVLLINMQLSNKNQALTTDSQAADMFAIIPGDGMTPGVPASCSNYKEYVETMRSYLTQMYAKCQSEPRPTINWQLDTESPDVILPGNDCQRIEAISIYLNGLEEFMKYQCSRRCPADLIVPTGIQTLDRAQ